MINSLRNETKVPKRILAVEKAEPNETNIWIPVFTGMTIKLFPCFFGVYGK
jgi:hypothetical protein